MNDDRYSIAIPADARPWLLDALAGAVRRLPDAAAAVPAAALTLARVLLHGSERATLEAQLAEWGVWATETHLVRVLVGQASAAFDRPPGVAWALPTTAYALDSLIVDLAWLPDWKSTLDPYVATRLRALLSEAVRADSPIGQMLAFALSSAGERPTVGDAVAIAAVARAAVTWSAQPIDCGPIEW